MFEKASIVVRSYDATVTEGNDALFKCTANSELYHVVAWHTDDGDIFLPFDQNTNCKWALFPANSVPFVCLFTSCVLL